MSEELRKRMFHSTNFSLHQTSSNNYNYKSLNDLPHRPISAKITRHSASTHRSDCQRSPPATLRKSHSGRSNYSSTSSYRYFPHLSLDDLVIHGQWKFRSNYDDRLQLKTSGIESLVYTCYDIMFKTRHSIEMKQKETSKLSLLQLEQFQLLNDDDRHRFRTENCYHLMTILFESTWTYSSHSHLIRIWREISTHHQDKHRSIPPPKLSYELALKQLIRSPDDQLLQIALHASLLSSFSRMDLQHFGERLGIHRHHFDMGSIRDSTKSFQQFLKIIREQKVKVEREQPTVDIHKLPYRPRKKRGLNANVAGTKFAVVRQAADVFGFSIGSEADFTTNLIWNDTLISMEIVSSLKPYQKVNHFPTMSEISRKDLLARNFEKVSRHLPNEYDFTPRTWLLPNEYNSWYSYASSKPKKDVSAYILKPNNGAMGHGIQVFCDYERIQPIDNYIIQEYIREPFLIDGYKFDLRIYALLTSCDPLRLFIFNNGLVRMSTEKYEIPNRKNSSHLFMHLTNYSVNKYNVDYQKSGANGDSEKTGSKRSLKFLFEYLRSQSLDATTLWRDIQNIIIKTVFLAQPHLFSAYRMCRPGASPSNESVCFELLGFDILVDQKLKPWVLEVNRCPSFGTNEQIDFDIKMKLLLDTFELLRFRTSDRKKSLAIEKADAQRRLYTNLSKPSRLLDDSSLILSNGNCRDYRTRQKKILDLKERLYLLQREAARETFENRHLGGFIRLFPVEDSIRMNELTKLLGKCFDILSSNKKDLSWSTKYYSRSKEEDLLDQLADLEEQEQVEQQRHPRLAFSAPSTKNNFSSWSYISLTDVSNNNLNTDRASPSASFASESSDENDDDRDDDGGKSEVTVPSELTNKSTSSTTQIFRLNNSLMKRFASQARSNVFRSTSISPAAPRKQRQTPVQSSSTNIRPTPLPQTSSPLVERKAPITSPNPTHEHRHHQPSRLINTNLNEKSSSVNISTLPSSSSMRKQPTVQVSTPGRSTSFNTLRENLPSDQELTRFHQLTLEQMHQLCIRYPNKSDDETRRLYNDIVDNWNKYRTSLGEFWLNRLDAKKRQAILKIVRNNVQQIMKQLWTHSSSIEHLSLTRHFLQLEQRLLNNNGQYLWEICQNKQSSLESFIGKTPYRISPIELACSHRFVELSKQALFIVYRYSLDEKMKRQQQQEKLQQQKNDGSTVMVQS